MHVGDRWLYRETYGDRCIAKMELIYPLIEDDVSKAPSVDIYFKSMAMVNEINKKLLIHFSIKVKISKRLKKNLCDHNQTTHRQLEIT